MADSEHSASVLAEAVKSGATIRVQNVINPLLRLSSFTLPSGLIGAVLLQGSPALAVGSMVVGALAPVATILAYAYFAVRAPQRLHSEEYLLAQQRLLLTQKGGAVESIDAVPIVEDLAALPSHPPAERTDADRS